MAGGATEQVKEGHQGFTFFNAEEKVSDGLTRDCVEHVFDVKEKEDPGWRNSKVAADLDTGRVKDIIKATFDGYAELASREEDFGKLGSQQVHDVFSGNAAMSTAHAHWVKFGVVGRVLVEGHEVIGGKGLLELWWDISIENEFKGAGE